MQIIASKKQTEAKRKQTQEAVEMWNSRAELAVKSGQDELAREALKKRKANEDQLKTWDQQLEQQNKAVDQLMGNTREMESKMQEAKSKKDTLKARAATAKSTKQVCWGLLYGCFAHAGLSLQQCVLSPQLPRHNFELPSPYLRPTCLHKIHLCSVSACEANAFRAPPWTCSHACRFKTLLAASTRAAASRRLTRWRRRLTR